MAANEKQFKESELKEAIAWSLAHLMKEVDEKVEDTTTKGYILKIFLSKYLQAKMMPKLNY